MIKKKPGELYFDHATGCCFTIGGRVVGAENSNYNGLYGRIMVIRSGADKNFDKDSDAANIYCEFMMPPLPIEKQRVKEMQVKHSAIE